MKTRISKSDFIFEPIGNENYFPIYKVTYVSPNTGIKFSTIITETFDKDLIDATKNTDNPSDKDLKRLKQFCTI